MGGAITPEFKQRVLEHIDIVELINSRVPLKKAGKDYQALCPFHNEKTPSFTVSPEKQFYYCFGCGASGDAISFLMNIDRLEFPEAVLALAERAGIPPPADDGQPHGPDLRPLYEMTEQAARLYANQLRTHPEAQRAVAYLKRRGLTGETARAFALGYAPPSWDFILGELGRDAAGRTALAACGLIVDHGDKRYDRFRDRIMFPIRDRRGRPIGFGARTLGDQKPKYLNSPETALFKKGHALYGIYEALRVGRRRDRILVVEGYMDVIALAQFGIDHAVATLGTATSTHHLTELKRITPELIFCFDGDQAGRKAASHAMETALSLATGEQDIRFLFLPEGEDPDSLIRREGARAFERRVQGSKPLSDLLFERLLEGIDRDTLEGRARLARMAQPLIDKVPQGVYRDLLQTRLSELVGVKPSWSPAPRYAANRSRIHPRSTLLGNAIAILLRHPELAHLARAQPADWRRYDNPGVAVLEGLLERIEMDPDLTPSELIEPWREHAYYKRLKDLSEAPMIHGLTSQQLAGDLTGALARLSDEVRRAEERDAEWRRATARIAGDSNDEGS